MDHRMPHNPIDTTGRVKACLDPRGEQKNPIWKPELTIDH